MSTPDYSKKILKILAENKAVSMPELATAVAKSYGGSQEKIASEGPKMAPKARYALNRSLRGLREAGLVESHFSGQNDYALLTPTGRRKATSLKLESDTTLLNPNWDGKWRIVLLDLPESRKNERESLRYLLKKAGFVCLKNSAWVSPFPFEHLFMNIKKDLGLSTELMIIVTDSLDPETEAVLLSSFGK
jgi:DNA-binding transcriptional regulator PaaX